MPENNNNADKHEEDARAFSLALAEKLERDEISLEELVVEIDKFLNPK